jgi:hypothetical protein
MPEDTAGQTIPPAECDMIFVDDGSGGYLDDLSASHQRVKVIRQENSLWPDALNAGAVLGGVLW